MTNLMVFQMGRKFQMRCDRCNRNPVVFDEGTLDEPLIQSVPDKWSTLNTMTRRTGSVPPITRIAMDLCDLCTAELQAFLDQRPNRG